MFTGIIGAIGVIKTIDASDENTVIVVEVSSFMERASIGDSVAIDGACLTVTEIFEQAVKFDAVPETLEKTSLGSLQAGSRVNLERAMSSNARFDGHIVQGHVDETGVVDNVTREKDGVRLSVACTSKFASLLVAKGSVAIAGVSLTVIDVSDSSFNVALIPHTLKETTLGSLERGTAVNLEADILGKYVKRYLSDVALVPQSS